MKNWKREFRELFVRSIGSAEDVISFIGKEKQKSYGEGRKRGVRFAEDKNDLTSVDVDKEGFGGELVEEARILREQYLEIEEKLKELGKTTKRVQTFVSKLKDNK